MKNILLISALAFAFLTGCVSNDMCTPENKAQKIVFTPPVVGVISKAHIGEISSKYPYPTNENFTVWAVYHSSTYEGWTTNAINYMNQVECQYDGSYDDDDVSVDGATEGKGGWSPEAAPAGKAYYWPKDGNLTFAAYSPSDVHSASPVGGDGTGTFEYGENGLTIDNFSVHADPKYQRDLLYGERTYNRTQSTGGNNLEYDGVDIKFRHALSSIQFKVQLKAHQSSPVVINYIKIGDVKYIGDFEEKINLEKDVNFDYESAAGWDPKGDLTTAPYFALSNSTGITLNDNYKEGDTDNYLDLDDQEGQNDLILMPQDFEDSSTAYLEITYTMSGVSQTKTVLLKEITGEWEIGKRYTYNITIGYGEISIVPLIAGWGDVPLIIG